MSTRPPRPASFALLPVVALALTACGGGEPSSAATAPSAEPVVAEVTPEAPVGPTVAAPTVAPLQIDDSVFNLYNGEHVQAAYDEVVELATDLAFDPDSFFRDGDNSGADLEPVLDRVATEKHDFLRGQADACVAGDSDACFDVMGIVFFDFGTDEVPYSFPGDMELVTGQAVSDPKAVGVIPTMGTSYLEISFVHTATIRFLHGGTPAVGTVTRHLTFHLDPQGGPSTQWLIDGWNMDYAGEVRDEATGQSLGS